VLIVDGHEDTRELYTLGLTFYGFEAAAIEDAGDAFSRARETHPDIIVMEIALPRVDGWALVEALRRNPQTAAIPVVVLTSHTEPYVRARAEREGCAAVLLKPYPPDQLAPALRDVLQNDSRS
jgi:CheY-like chemotaxis protein